MKASFFLYGLAALLSGSLLTQQVQAQSLPPYKNLIGINADLLADLWSGGGSYPLQVQYKRQVKPYRALRTSISGGGSNRENYHYTSTDTAGNVYTSKSQSRFIQGGFSIGYEWQKPIGKYFLLYGGFDMSYGIAWSKSYSYTPDNQIHPSWLYLTQSLSLTPLAGLRFNWNHLSLLTEMKMVVQDDYTSSYGYFSYNNYKPSYWRESTNFKLYFRPYTGVVLFYSF